MSVYMEGHTGEGQFQRSRISSLYHSISIIRFDAKGKGLGMSGRRDVRDLPTLWPRYEQGVNLIDEARKDDIVNALTFQFLHRGTRVIKYEGL